MMSIYQPKPTLPRVYHRAGAPALWLPMDGPRRTFSGDTGDVADLMGGLAAGTRAAGCTWADGPAGKCLSFDGVAGRVTLPASAALNITGPITLSCRLRTTASGGQLIYGGYGAGFAGCGLGTGILSPGKVAYWDGSAWVEGTSAVNDGAWHHVAVVASGSTASYYVDGKLDRAAASGQPTSYAGVRAIGSTATAATNLFTGNLDDVRVYSRALPAAEVAREAVDPWWRLRPQERIRAAGRAAKTFLFPPPATGALAATAGPASIAAGLTMGATGSLSVTAGPASIAAGLTMGATGSLSVTAGPAQVAANLTAGATGALAATAGPASIDMEGTATTPPDIGSLAVTAGPASIAAVLSAGCDDLIGAVRALFYTDTRLLSDLAGHLYLGEAAAAGSMPYAIVADDSHLELKTSSTEAHKTTLRFKVYATDADVAGPIGDHVESALRGQSLSWTGGWSSPLVPQDRRQRADDGTRYIANRAKGGAKAFTIEVSFTCRTVRTLS